MKTSLNLFTCLLLSLALHGQGATPLWVNDAWREAEYPASNHYTGFAVANVRSGEGVEAAAARAMIAAKSELSEKIRVKIASQKTAHKQSVTYNSTDEQLRETYAAAAQTEAQAEVVGLQLQTHHDRSKLVVYALAAVKRADLAAYYQMQVSADLNKAEAAVAMARQHLTERKKTSARGKANEAMRILESESLTLYNDLLIAVAGESELTTKRQNDLERRIAQLLMDIEQSAATAVYMDCSFLCKGTKDDAFSDDNGAFCDIIIAALYENDFQVVESEAEADYTLTIITSTTQRSDGSHEFGIVTYYANARGWLINRQVNREIANFRCEGRGCAPYSTSASDAFKSPTLKDYVLERIIPKIKN